MGQLVQLLIFLLTAVFVYGRTAQKQDEHTRQLGEHKERLDGHEDRLNDHTVKIEKAEAWREGYNAAKSSR